MSNVQVKYVNGGKVVKMPERYARPLIKLGHVVLFEVAPEPAPAAEVLEKPRRVRKAKDVSDEQE